MKELIEIIDYKGLKINIYQDNDYNPDEEDKDLFLVGYHRDFTVKRDEIVTKDEIIKAMENTKISECCGYEIYDRHCEFCGNKTKAVKPPILEKYHIFGLEAYIHSGVSLALSGEGNFPDRRWDASQLGAVFVAKKEWTTKAKARKAALGLIEMWNSYLSGQVYGYVIEGGESDISDSCWGFLGDIKYCIEEAKSAANHIAEKTRYNRQKLVKSLIRNGVPLEIRQLKLT
jgi:hypothetical protein